MIASKGITGGLRISTNLFILLDDVHINNIQYIFN